MPPLTALKLVTLVLGGVLSLASLGSSLCLPEIKNAALTSNVRWAALRQKLPLPFRMSAEFEASNADKLYRLKPDPVILQYTERVAAEGLFSAPLLTADQEMHLFRRMNYLRYYANGQLGKSYHISRLLSVEAALEEASYLKGLIVAANTRLARQAAPDDDAFSDATDTLVRVTGSFDYTRGYRFSTYLVRSIENDRIKSYWRRQRFSRECGVDGFDLFSGSREQDACASVEQADLVRRMLEFFDELSEEEKTILTHRMELGGAEFLTHKELAERLGRSRSGVGQMEIDALLKLRLRMEKDLSREVR